MIDINDKYAVILYFRNNNCGVCNVLLPKVRKMVESNFPKFDFLEIDIQQHIEDVVRFQVYSTPLILCFIEGKECFRESGNVSISEMRDKIQRLYNIAF